MQFLKEEEDDDSQSGASSDSNSSDEGEERIQQEYEDLEVPGGLRGLAPPDRLAVLGARHGASHAFLNDLLEMFRDLGHPDFPKDARTLLHTSRTPIPNSSLHFIDNAVLNGIIMQLKTGFQFEDRMINLELSIDGIPVFKSPPKGFWPVLCRVVGANDPYPFFCGAYFGDKKPDDMDHDLLEIENLDNFLQPIIQEILRLQEVGIDFNEEHFDVRLLCVGCDAPARSLVKCIIAHNGCSSLR